MHFSKQRCSGRGQLEHQSLVRRVWFQASLGQVAQVPPLANQPTIWLTRLWEQEQNSRVYATRQSRQQGRRIAPCASRVALWRPPVFDLGEGHGVSTSLGSPLEPIGPRRPPLGLLLLDSEPQVVDSRPWGELRRGNSVSGQGRRPEGVILLVVRCALGHQGPTRMVG